MIIIMIIIMIIMITIYSNVLLAFFISVSILL